MVVVSFNFNKIVAERKSAPRGGIKVSSNVSIKDVEPIDFNLGNSKQKALKYIYEFISKFEPDVGSLEITGDILDLQEDKKVDEIVKGWKKDKQLKKEVVAPIINLVLSKCNIKALMLSQDVNLPSPIKLPRVK